MLGAAGFAAGTVNAVAGGGSFFTFAALVASGLTTLDANATSAVALTPANLAGVAAYRSEIRSHFRELIVFGVLAIVGGVLGALLLIWLGDDGFRPLVPWLLLVASLLFGFSNRIRALVGPTIMDQGLLARLVAFSLMTLVAIYGGFFGAGFGIMMLAVLAIVESGDFHKLNATKNLQAFLIQVVSGSILIAGGLVHWPQALVTVAASVSGSYFGIRAARRVPERIIRAVVITAGSVLTTIFFLR